MPKASVTLANGTVVNIEGTMLEVQNLLSFYGQAAKKPANGPTHKLTTPITDHTQAARPDDETSSEVDLVAIVNQIRSCDEAESIETHILDRTDQLPRVLLPMYIVYEHMNNAHALTSGQISKVTVQLAAPVKLPNVSKILSGPAAKYIIGDAARKKGQTVRYKLSRRGHAYLKAIIAGPKAH